MCRSLVARRERTFLAELRFPGKDQGWKARIVLRGRRVGPVSRVEPCGFRRGGPGAETGRQKQGA
eukprot:scaffold40807_cov78-Phaeocystis_antarctica.AAC.1